MPEKVSSGLAPWIQVGEDHYINMHNVASVAPEGDTLTVLLIGEPSLLFVKRDSEAARRILVWVSYNSQV